MDSPFLCLFCKHSLVQDSIILSSRLGLLVMCLNCRALYYLRTAEIKDQGVLVTLLHADLDDEEAFDIIRHSECSQHRSLGNFLDEQSMKRSVSIDHLQPDVLKDAVKSSVTPSDLIRRLESI